MHLPSYLFESIGAAQALAFSSQDSLTVSSTSARNTTVLFNADGTFSIGTPDRTVIFGAELQYATGSRLTFSDGSQLYIGSPQPDTKDFGVLPSTGAMYGGAGGDSLTAGHGAWLVQGNQGDDVIVADAGGSNTIYGGQDNDRITIRNGGFASDPGQFEQGNKGSDTLQGGGGADTLLGGQGNDVIYGSGGGDFINGNLGDDHIVGSGTLYGEGGNDTLETSASSTISGGDGDDLIVVGGASGQVAHDVASGDAGNDTISGLSDNVDELHGGDGNDRLSIVQNGAFGAVSQNAFLDGGAGDDTMTSRGGQDSLAGGDGSDSVSSGEAADTLSGGAGADTLAGGSGADLFVQTDRTAALSLSAADRIVDWESNDHIRFRISSDQYGEIRASNFDDALMLAKNSIDAGTFHIVAVEMGSDVVLFADAGPGTTVDSIVVLVGRTLADVSRDNFV